MEDSKGVCYRYHLEGGGVVVTRCIARGARVQVPALLDGHAVVALGDESFASSEKSVLSMKPANGQLERVELPEGIVSIGRAAFRGCSRLASVLLPESLERIGDLAFSCTSVSSIRLPRCCAHLSQLALRTGPESLEGPDSPYLSKIDRIEVDSGNSAYCVHGNVLCRRIGGSAFEAILCPGSASELDFGGGIERIAPTAFAGTYEIGKLRFNESIGFVDGCGIAVNATCRTVEVILDASQPRQVLTLAMPSKGLQRAVFESTKGRDNFNLQSFLSAYDAALEKEADRLLQAKLMLARLARPVCLGARPYSLFGDVLRANLVTLIVRFGATNYWQGYDDMIDAGLLDSQSISSVVDVLASREDSTAVARLLALKRSRFADEGWDYGL